MSQKASRAILRPANPELFVAEAARITNAADFAGAAAMCSPCASATLLIDGAVEEYHGVDEIARAWEAMYGALRERSIWVTKRLVSAGADTIVNDWHAGPGMQGLEVWRFDEEGRVHETVLQGFADVRPFSHPWARLRVALNAPKLALTMRRHQALVGLWPRRRTGSATPVR